jgi:hypothetical protein
MHTVCGKDADFFCVRASGTYNNQRLLIVSLTMGQLCLGCTQAVLIHAVNWEARNEFRSPIGGDSVCLRRHFVKELEVHVNFCQTVTFQRSYKRKRGYEVDKLRESRRNDEISVKKIGAGRSSDLSEGFPWKKKRDNKQAMTLHVISNKE